MATNSVILFSSVGILASYVRTKVERAGTYCLIECRYLVAYPHIACYLARTHAKRWLPLHNRSNADHCIPVGHHSKSYTQDKVRWCRCSLCMHHHEQPLQNQSLQSGEDRYCCIALVHAPVTCRAPRERLQQQFHNHRAGKRFFNGWHQCKSTGFPPKILTTLWKRPKLGLRWLPKCKWLHCMHSIPLWISYQMIELICIKIC